MEHAAGGNGKYLAIPFASRFDEIQMNHFIPELIDVGSSLSASKRLRHLAVNRRLGVCPLFLCCSAISYG
jgi:hypothetical protein